MPSPPPTKIAPNWFSVPYQERKPCVLLIKTSPFPQRSSSLAYESLGIIQSNKLASSVQTIFSENKRLLPVACKNLNDSEGSERDDRAMETVLRLYRAIRQKNMDEVSDLIGEECRCISNFVYRFQAFHGKKQVLEFFSSLIKCLGNNIEFVVQPSLHDGMDVSISWKLECTKTHAPLGKGFSFIMCHLYQGKVTIRNVEMFIEPLLHMEPLRLKMRSLLMNEKEEMNSQEPVRDKTQRTLKTLCALLCIAAFIFFLVNSKCTLRHRTRFGR
nr:Galectin-9 like [Ipomoea batatas]